MFARLVLVIMLLGVVFGSIFGWKHHQAQQRAAQAAAPPPPATVAAAPVQRASWQPYLHAVGSLTATKGVYVSNEVAGQISEINFRSGERVEDGQVLVRLDDRADQADLDGLIAARRLAELRFQRIASLYKKDSASEAQYDEAQAELDSARAKVAAKRARIEKKRIRAPFAGLLGIRKVNLGEYLAPGAQIVRLQSLDPIYADFTLPERKIGQLNRDQNILLEVQPYPDTTFEGRITAIEPGVDPGTRNVDVRATLSNPSSRLRPGMFAEVRVVLPARDDVLTIPRTAVSYNPYGDSVFIIKEKDDQLTVERKQIETGAVRDGRVEVLSGLEEGQRIVSAGHVKLRNGQRITVDNSVDLSNEVPDAS